MSASGRNVTVVPVGAPAGSFSPLTSSLWGAPREYSCEKHVAVAADLHEQALRERVDDRDADAVQAAGDLVAAAVAELAAGVKDGEHDLDGGAALLLHVSQRGSRGRCRTTVTELSGWIVTATSVQKPGQRLVDGVVDDLVDEVVQAHDAGRADVHARALANGLQALEDGDVLCVVAGGRARHRRVVDAALAGVRFRAVAALANGPPMT